MVVWCDGDASSGRRRRLYEGKTSQELAASTPRQPLFIGGRGGTAGGGFHPNSDGWVRGGGIHKGGYATGVLKRFMRA